MPCQICGKNDYCSINEHGTVALCRRPTGAGREKVDKNGVTFWIHRLKEPEVRYPISPISPAKISRIDLAKEETRHAVYSALLEYLPLNQNHRKNLNDRMLTDDEIASRGYRSLPIKGRHEIATQLVDRFGLKICVSIPGLIEQGGQSGKSLTIAGPVGTVVPCRNQLGQVIALKMRRDTFKPDDPRYVYISSKRYGGPGPGAPVHFPLHSFDTTEVVRITEGELKADVSTALSSILTISIPGVSSWQIGITAIKALSPKIVRVAFDIDIWRNYEVANSLKNLVAGLRTFGFCVEIETWT